MTDERVRSPREERWSGPSLRDGLQRNLPRSTVVYAYIDGRGRVGHPEWLADRIRVRVFYAHMGAPLEPVLAEVEQFRGFQSGVIVRGHKELRPLVEAIFERGELKA